MATFQDLLARLHNYLPADFASGDGEVVIDCGKGVVHPLGTDGKSVALREVFQIGQYVSLALDGGGDRFRFIVIGVNQDGVDAVAATGERGFLPWQAMAAALRRSRQVYVDVLSELEELDAQDQAFVQEEIVRLTDEVRSHRASVSDLSRQLDKLQSIGQRPVLRRPSSWLQGG